ncbi:MAG: tyrosine-type recombinase/integrase [Proteobacteria bacterium]|nr:tyrosine-type recombinase/integrase [Pseudomonadota bacterium]MBU1698494.1 tyrosine-type recombinase/integrase [Pseudomonadota bacterium]
MNQLHETKSAIDSVLRIMAEREYAASTIKTHRGILNSLIKFMEKNHYTKMEEHVGLAYIKERTGATMNGFWGPGNQKINTTLKPVQNLFYYLDNGDLSYFMRSKIKPFQCPFAFKSEYQLFQKEYRERNYANATIVCNNNIVRRLLTFLLKKVNSSDDITITHLTEFLAAFAGCRPRYVSTVLYVLRNYFTFLQDMNIIKTDLAASLPHVRILRNAFIPHAWETDDVRKLLASIDRNSTKGKRDYAILLMIVHLGLRVSDIRNMRLSDLNWNRKTITLSVRKTGQALELPLLDDIGWAIIDYLKNGRPQTACNRLFVRHRAPFDSFGENQSFYSELHRYMQVAGITPPTGVHCGLHSLRSTLARNMLEAKTPLPVISEVLGHTNINTTSIYLKIDLDGLRKCALDPEEVL